MKMDATCGYMPPSGDQCQICRVLGTSWFMCWWCVCCNMWLKYWYEVLELNSNFKRHSKYLIGIINVFMFILFLFMKCMLRMNNDMSVKWLGWHRHHSLIGAQYRLKPLFFMFWVERFRILELEEAKPATRTGQ
jgi:hypothetical protein